MSTPETSIIRINCTVTGPATDLTSVDANTSMPVLKVTALATDWSPPQTENFIVIFTSKQAVQIFIDHVLLAYPDAVLWTYCTKICAVGEATALLAQKLLPNFFFRKEPTVIYPDQAHGLDALFNLLQSSSAKSTAVIFTAEDGRTKEIIKKLGCPDHFLFDVIPLYFLSQVNKEEHILFLDNLFQQKGRFIFCCNSGKILSETVSILRSYFSVQEPQQLPKNLFFSVWGASTKETLAKLNLIDRTFL